MKCSGALPEKRNEVFQRIAPNFSSSFSFWLRPAFDFSRDAPFALGQFSFFFPSSFFGFFIFCRIRLGNDGSLGAGGVTTFAQFVDSHAEGCNFLVGLRRMPGTGNSRRALMECRFCLAGLGFARCD